MVIEVAAESERVGLAAMLMFACLGFAAGWATWRGGSVTSARVSSVMAARAAGHTAETPRSGVSRASRGGLRFSPVHSIYARKRMVPWLRQGTSDRYYCPCLVPHFDRHLAAGRVRSAKRTCFGEENKDRRVHFLTSRI